MGTEERSASHARRQVFAQVADRRDSTALERSAQRHGIYWPASGATRIRGDAGERNPLLPTPPHHCAWRNWLGTDQISLRLNDRRCQGKAAVRPLLHQAYELRSGPIRHVPDDQDCAVAARCAVKMLFWSAVALSCYSFLGYPLLMWLVSRLRNRPVNKLNFQPTISVVMAVRNGGASLPAKLKNLRELSYPRELIEYVVASDGSNDETLRIITSAPDVRAIS